MDDFTEEEKRFYKYVRPRGGKTYVFAILDRSGSMTGLIDSTVSGYNEFIGGLKDEKIRVSLTTFSDTSRLVYSDKSLHLVPKLTKEQYLKGGMGMTALIDAVCSTLNTGKDLVGKKDKAVVLIITDGLENMSREYTSRDLNKLIKGLTAEDNWTFTYIGANQDSWEIAQNWGFKKGNVSNYNSTERGTQSVYQAASMSTQGFSASSATNTGALFSDEQKKKMEETK